MNLPEGWKLVPVEPTEEMCSRAAESCKYASSSEQWLGGYTPENVEGLYKVMLAAAPTPPDQECGTAFSCPECGAECMHVSIPNAHWHKCKSCDWSSKPAQEDEPVYQLNVGPDKWWDVDKEAFDQVTIDAPQKRVLYTRPQPKAQEDEPDYWLIKSQDYDDPFLVDNKDTLELYLNAGLKLEAELYARPQSDELRRAAEELLQWYDRKAPGNSGDVEILIQNLRTALERK